MEGDRMRNKKFAAFFNRKSYIVAAVIMVVAAFGMMGLYYAKQEREQEEQLAKERQEQVQQAREEDAAREKAAKERAEARAAAEVKEKIMEQKKEEEETEEVSGIITPEQEDNFMDEPEVVAETSAAASWEPEIHFDAAADLSWPIQGNVILNYNMDQTVYFATLDQYKYNPAVIIQAAVNTPVNAVASGQVTSIETNEETGLTMTVDMGDGYSARYGQLKEIPKDQGDYVESGETIGYINEPAKYYSVEGSNLYFQLLKDGQPVNPMEYLE